MPLQNIYRPENFNEFSGNDEALKALYSVLNREDDVPKSYLITGPSGCGKTSLARIIKNMLSVSNMNFRELDAADDRKIDDIRNIKNSVRYSAIGGGNKLVLFDEAHQLPSTSQEAMLKMLEEPPSNTYFVLATTDPEKLKVTIKRRCHIIDLKPFARSIMSKFLNDIYITEDVPIQQKVIDHIAKNCDGSPGKALSMLDGVIDIEEEDDALAILETMTGRESTIVALCKALLNQPTWNKIRKMIPNLVGEPETIRRGILGYLEKVLLSREFGAEVAEMMAIFADVDFMISGKAGLTLAIYQSTVNNE